MEPSGHNPWQPLSKCEDADNGSGERKTVAVGCDRLRPVATGSAW
jgi:hypothetical protein